MQKTLMLSVLIMFFSNQISQAQNVRDDSADGTTSHAFRNSAEEQNRKDWPIKSQGYPGTAVRLTFDFQNADIDIVTDKSYGREHLLATIREIAQKMEMPKTDFIRFPDSEASVNADMEFNKYIKHPSKQTSSFEFDLARFANALKNSDLPKPIILGIRSDHSNLNRVQLLTPHGSKTLDGIVFLNVDEVQPGTRLNWMAELHWTGYAFALLTLGMFILIPFTVLISVLKIPKLTLATSSTPTEVQEGYNKSPPQILLLMGMPVVITAFVMTGNISRAMESMVFLFPSNTIIYCASGTLVLLIATTIGLFMKRKDSIQQDKQPNDPDEPPGWTKSSFIIAMLPIFLIMMPFLLIRQYWNPFRSLPIEWRHTAPIWLPITFLVVGLTPAIIAGFISYMKTHRKMKPGEFWHDRVMDLARKAGVPVKGVVEIWSSTANANASIFGTVGLTRGLIHKLPNEEIDVIIVHELGHLTGSHPRRAIFTSLAITLTFLVMWFGGKWYLEHHYILNTDTKAILRSPIFFLFALPLIRTFIQSKGNRKMELAADRFAVDVIGDAALVIRALTRIHDLNYMPHRLKTADEALSTHPSLEHRINAIRAYAALK